MGEKASDLGAAIAALGEQGKEIAASLSGGSIPAVHSLPEGVRVIIESVYGSSVASVFLVAAPLGFLTILAVAFLPNLALSSQTRQQRMAADAEAAAVEGAPDGLEGSERAVESGLAGTAK